MFQKIMTISLFLNSIEFFIPGMPPWIVQVYSVMMQKAAAMATVVPRKAAFAGYVQKIGTCRISRNGMNLLHMPRV